MMPGMVPHQLGMHLPIAKVDVTQQAVAHPSAPSDTKSRASSIRRRYTKSPVLAVDASEVQPQKTRGKRTTTGTCLVCAGASKSLEARCCRPVPKVKFQICNSCRKVLIDPSRTDLREEMDALVTIPKTKLVDAVLALVRKWGQPRHSRLLMMYIPTNLSYKYIIVSTLLEDKELTAEIQKIVLTEASDAMSKTEPPSSSETAYEFCQWLDICGCLCLTDKTKVSTTAKPLFRQEVKKKVRDLLNEQGKNLPSGMVASLEHLHLPDSEDQLVDCQSVQLLFLEH
eukprot:m.270467 g.270467  ORF g.270467 m.270467 type:complete len:284 (+) comp15680_c2_seq5:2711-3562(+)